MSQSNYGDGIRLSVAQLFRYSFLAQYTIYNIATGDMLPVSPVPPAEMAAPPPAYVPTAGHGAGVGPGLGPGPLGPPFLLDAAWAGRGSALLMVYDYDIYYKPAANATKSYRITNTAVPGVICNGIPDWLYEGEWSPRQSPRRGPRRADHSVTSNFTSCLDTDLSSQTFLHSRNHRLPYEQVGFQISAACRSSRNNLHPSVRICNKASHHHFFTEPKLSPAIVLSSGQGPRGCGRH